jgi:hypothetical protein
MRQQKGLYQLKLLRHPYWSTGRTVKHRNLLDPEAEKNVARYAVFRRLFRYRIDSMKINFLRKGERKMKKGLPVTMV